MRRAVRDEHKQQRRQALLDAAWFLFQRCDFEAINVADVAQQAGLAKGTVYLYFTTKEELFLALQGQQFSAWFDEVDEQLATLEAPAPIAQVVDLFVRSLSARPSLIRLFAIAHSVLERNVSPAAVLSFKRLLRDRLAHTAVVLEGRLPVLAPGEGVLVLLRAYALIIGLQSLADPAPAVREVMREHTDLSLFLVEFAPHFTAAFSALLHGWGASRGGTHGL